MNVTPGAENDYVAKQTPCVLTTLNRAYAYALDPTPEQVSMLRSHVGGSRFAYNALLGLVKENWDENRAKNEAGLEVAKNDWVDASHFGLLYLWAEQIGRAHV